MENKEQECTGQGRVLRFPENISLEIKNKSKWIKVECYVSLNISFGKLEQECMDQGGVLRFPEYFP